MSKKGGGGVISNPKNFIANLRKLTHIYKFSQKKAQCNFQKWGGGGGQRPFGSFPKKHPVWTIQTSLMKVQMERIGRVAFVHWSLGLQSSSSSKKNDRGNSGRMLRSDKKKPREEREEIIIIIQPTLYSVPFPAVPKTLRF